MLIPFQQYLKRLAKLEKEQEKNDPLPDQKGYVRKWVSKSSSTDGKATLT